VIALVRDHLKPGELFKKRAEVGDGAFRRLAGSANSICSIASPGPIRWDETAHGFPDKWFDAKAQEWFIERAKELAVDHNPPPPLCWVVT